MFSKEKEPCKGGKMGFGDFLMNVVTLGAHQRVKDAESDYMDKLQELNELNERHERNISRHYRNY